MIDDFVLGGICCSALTVVVWRLVPRVLRAFGFYRPRNVVEARIDLERRIMAVVQSSGDAAMDMAELVRYAGELPKQFEPTAFLGLNLAQMMQREMLREHERLGIVREGVADEVMGPERPAAPPPAYAPEAPEEAPAESSNVRRLRGRLVILRQASG